MTIISKQWTKPIEGLCCDASTLPNLSISVYSVSSVDKIHEDADIFYGDHTSQHAKLFSIKSGIDFAIDTGQKIIWTNSDCCVKWINNGNISVDVKDRSEIIKLTSIIHRLCKEHVIEVRFWQKRLWGKIPGHLTKGAIKSILMDGNLMSEPKSESV